MIIQLETGHKLEVPDGSTPEQIDEVVGHFSQNAPKMQPAKAEPQPNRQQPTEGLVRTVFDQGMQGATFGFADEVSDRLGAKIASLATGQPYDEMLSEARNLTKERQERQFEQHPVASVASNVAGGLLTGGAGAETNTGKALINSLRSGNPIASIGKGLVSGAVSGGVYGAGTADDGDKLRGTVKGAISGGVIGGAVPAVAVAGSALKNAVAPTIEKSTAALAQRAKDFGIPLRLDQISPTRVRQTVQKISQQIPGSGVDAFEAGQRQAVAKAVAKTIGEDAEDLGPSVIQSFRKNIGRRFDKSLQGQTIKISDDTTQALSNIVNEADRTIDDSLVNVVRKNADDLLEQIKSGEISGEKLSSIRSQILKRSTKSKNDASQFLNDMIDVIDNNIDQSLSPEKLSELADARKQWRNFKTIQPLLEKSTDGTINPTQLLDRVAANKFIDASKVPVGEDDLIDIARIGKKLLTMKGGSDTFQKSALGGGIAGLGIMAASNPLAAMALGAKAAAGMAANRGFQAVNSSQKLIDLAIKNSGKAAKKLSRPASTALLEGNAGGLISRK